MSSRQTGDAAGATSAPPAVEVTGLHKGFGDLEVLKGVSLSAGDGDVVAIIGASGSGKSTMHCCINMLELPSGGSISIQGEEIEMKPDGRGGLQPANSARLRRIRTRLAMVFQGFNLWQHMTLLGNVIEAPVQVMGVLRDEATPLVATITVVDVYAIISRVRQDTYLTYEPLLLLALIYMILTGVLVLAYRWLEAKVPVKG